MDENAGGRNNRAGRWANWLPWLIFMIAVTARLLPGTRTIDDSFITYRYARNILAGNGFVYNPGEKVLGTTTPLYTALMAAGAALSGGAQAPFPVISLWVNALADSLTWLLLIRLGERLGSRRFDRGFEHAIDQPPGELVEVVWRSSPGARDRGRVLAVDVPGDGCWTSAVGGCLLSRRYRKACAP